MARSKAVHFWKPWMVLGLMLLLSVGAMCELDGLDDPSAPSEPAAGRVQHDAFAKPPKAKTTGQAGAKPKRPSQRPVGPPPKVGKYEMLAGVFLTFYVINVLMGRYQNNKIAQAWAKAFAETGGVFDKNFSALGAPGKEKLMQEAGNCYKFYASGRRHVMGLLATLNLKARQDVLSMLWYIISPTEDLVTLEAYMTEASMPPIVVAVGQPKALRRLAQDHLDLLKYTKKIQAPKDSLPGWPNEKLHIQTEHSNIFTELFSDPRVLNTLNPTGPHAKSFKYMRSMHFTNECSEGTYKRVLRFTFALPSASNMEDLAPLMALVPLFIDLVGSYKLSPELKKKAEAARAKSQENNQEEERKLRQEALMKKKQEKLLEEKAKLARLPPAERQRAEDKLQKRMMEKQMKKRTKMV